VPDIVVIDTPSLGDRSYLVHDGEVAFVVDPQRDIDRVLDAADRLGVRITHVFETHIHNDYVTGGLALARQTGADYHVNGADPVGFERVAIGDGAVVTVSPTMSVRALATPGHTHTHLSYSLTSGGRPTAVFTGGSLLYGATGRPDLVGPEHTEPLARAQHRSAHRLAEEHPDEAAVLPTHGFGSFCAPQSDDAAPATGTIGGERATNPALRLGEEDFVAGLLSGLDAWPAYYVHMGPANLAGPSAPDLSPPPPADPVDIERRISAGEWVVDVRPRTDFAAGHVPGSRNVGLDGSFATYLGWLIPWGTPLTLLAETEEQLAEAQRELARIGIDRPDAAAVGNPADWSSRPLRQLPRATFRDLAAVDRRAAVVLDVRRQQEWREGHLAGAVHLPLHELQGRLAEVPAGTVYVHCAGGYRASLAAAMLAAAGREVVAVDDEFAAAEPAGLAIERPAAGSARPAGEAAA